MNNASSVLVRTYDSMSRLLQDVCGGETEGERYSHALSGGDIGSVRKIEVGSGSVVVAKHYSGSDAHDMYLAEGTSLNILAMTNSIATIKVHGCVKGDREGCIVFEYCDNTHAPANKLFWERFAHDLAALHTQAQILWKKDSSVQGVSHKLPYYGAAHPLLYKNFIGNTIQVNTPMDSWVDFFIQKRILYQSELACTNGFFDNAMMKKATMFCKKLEAHIPEPDAPSLLHGDLWSGNYLCRKDEVAVLIDPALYYGHYEADIAMTELFGGFPPSFYDAYSEVLLLDREYRAVRKRVYNLYHLLNHLNLFGSAYLSQVMVMFKIFD